MTTRRRLLIIRTLAIGLPAGAVLATGAAPLHAQRVMPYPPVPPPRHGGPPPGPPPRPDLAWRPGHWQWDGRGYLWVEGGWAPRPPHGRAWREGRWAHHRGDWVWEPGGWY